MEFALYGSLKHYLKGLSTDGLAPLHRHPMRHAATQESSLTHRPSGSQCLCPCHSLSGGGTHSYNPAQRGGANDQSEGEAASTTHTDAGYNDPAIVAHAARLLRLLDSNYYHQSGSNTNKDRINPNSGSDSSSAGGREPYAEDDGMCVYHSNAEERPYYWVQHSISQYYNNGCYYNSQHTDAPLPQTPSSQNPNSPEIESLLSCPSYANLPLDHESGHSDNRCCAGHCDCVASHHSSCCSIHDSNDGGVTGERYPNVASGCIYCSEQKEGAGGGEGNCLCPDMAVMEKGRLSYFEVLDYACQIASGMEHLEKMKVHCLGVLSGGAVSAGVHCLGVGL
jgi:hypothetical protein